MYANRSGKITVELHDDFTATGYIDGKKVYKGSIFQKVSVKTLNKAKWDVEIEVSPAETKEDLWGMANDRKVKFLNNPSKEFYKTHTVTPSQFCKVFNAAVFKSAIAPYKDFASLYFQRKSNIPGKFASVVKNHDMLVQAMKDGQKNILPIINNCSKTPQELKKELGKGLWKKLCANSFYRNKLIANTTEVYESSIKWDSGALKGRHPHARHWAKNVCKVPYVKMKGQYTEEVQLFLDTERMADNMGLPFNENWSKLKMKEKHDEYMNIQIRDREEERKKRDEFYRLRIEKLQSVDLSKVYPQIEFELDGVKATILTTYDQVRQEGVVMHHCVGTYAEQAMDGAYVVVHISGDGEETTLGLCLSNHWTLEVDRSSAEGTLSMNAIRNFVFNQHYGKCNSQVVSEKHKAIVEVVIKYLNNLKLTKESYEGV